MATPATIHAADLRSRTAPVGLIDDVRLPGALFVAVGAAFVIVTMLAASLAPGYDFHGGKISDLGVIDETALIFNVLLIGIGVFNAVGGLLLYRRHGHAWLLVVYLIAAIGAAGAGLFPLNTGGPHAIFALLAFVFINLEAVATATIVPGTLIRSVSVIAGVVGLIYVMVMVVGDGGDPAVFGAIGHGGSERMIVYPAMLWLLVFGGYLLAAPGTPARSR